LGATSIWIKECADNDPVLFSRTTRERGEYALGTQRYGHGASVDIYTEGSE
jgi:hypothetical protein